MSNESSGQANLNKRRELIDITNQLNEEGVQLLETSRVLRQESRHLSEDSHLLRQLGITLLCDENP